MTRLYRIYNCWVDPETAKEMLTDWVNKNGHICNRVIDPSTCCPVAHGGEKCTCVELRRLQYRDFLSS